MCLAIPGKIIAIEDSDEQILRTGKVSFDGIIKEVNLGMLPDAGIDDYVLVHVGVAIGKISAKEASNTLEYIRQLEESGM